MDNRQIARILRETAQLLEIDGAIIGRYRSYEKAAELIEGLPQPVEQLVDTPEKLLELPGIGHGMVEHLTEIVKTGDYALRRKMLKKYPATILELLSLQSLGPKKVLFLWKKFQCATVTEVEKLAREGKLRDLAGFGEKSEQNILKAVETFKKGSGRFLISTVESAAAEIAEHIEKAGRMVESVTPAGSLRRGKETVGDLDLLVTMAAEKSNKKSAASRTGARNSVVATRQEVIDEVAKHILKYPRIDQVLAHGENKVSFTLSNGLQVDVRLLEKENFGAALLYFTGSKEHNVRLRGRANDMGWTLNEYDLATLKGETRGRKDRGGDLRKIETAICAPGIARERRGDRSCGESRIAEARRAARHQGRFADALDGQRREKHRGGDGRGGQGTGTRVHRDHRSFESGDGCEWS